MEYYDPEQKAVEHHGYPSIEYAKNLPHKEYLKFWETVVHYNEAQKLVVESQVERIKEMRTDLDNQLFGICKLIKQHFGEKK